MSERLRTAFRDRDPVLGHWLSIGHPAVAEVMAMAEGDVVLIDTEHTPTEWETLQSLIHAIEAADGDSEPLVRLPENDPVAVKRALDTGASAIMAPMVDTPAEARELVSAATYPPEGTRGVGGSRAAGYGINFTEYVTEADEQVTVVAQIEREAAVTNAEAIAAVDGIDALFLGPSDLSASLDTFGDLESDVFVDAVSSVLDAADAENTSVGLFVPDPTEIERWLTRGFDYVIAGKDTIHLWEGLDDVSTIFAEAVETQE
ncbi:HpcH/HpaI aldolase/citrate lyase family protein [Halopenitus sp. H-Gu1]|uniref:HpcH/HpaI aldolase family protein n=1 Tax=Halopenitus sp. H-Gu1 TaxID=3242697 RepID=UPI00359E5B5A